MNKFAYVVEVETAWWLRPYFYALETICALTGRTPDEAKLARMIDRAIRVRVFDK